MSDDPAKARFFAIGALRLAGAVLVAAGLAIVSGKVALPRLTGVAVALLGLFGFAVLPVLLARRWRSPPQ